MDEPNRLLSCLMMVMMMMMQVCYGGRLINEDEQFEGSNSNSDAEKVKLYLYYESLCPYSARFIVKDLAAIFDNSLIDIVDLKLFPWGNAKLRSDLSFTCQHGAAECLLNTIEACAIDTWPALSQNFPFIYCVENLVYERKYKEWETCFDKLGLDSKPVKECYSSGKGTQLELKYAAETDALKPPHKYVPWVVVNGQPLYEDYENFTSYVCKAYKGTPPSACNTVSYGSSPTFHSHQVSYADKALAVALMEKEANNVAVM